MEREAAPAPRALSEPDGKHWFDDELFRSLMRLRGMESAYALCRGVHLSQAPPRARMIFRETVIDGCSSGARATRGRAWLLRAHMGPRGVATQGLTGRSSSAASRSTGAAARCAASISRILPTRRRSSSGARLGRSSTSPSISALTRRPTVNWVGVRAHGGEPAGALRSRRLRTRLPDTRRTTARWPYQISEPHAPEAARGVRCDDPAFGDRLADRGRRHQRARPVVPGLRPVEAPS